MTNVFSIFMNKKIVERLTKIDIFDRHENKNHQKKFEKTEEKRRKKYA